MLPMATGIKIAEVLFYIFFVFIYFVVVVLLLPRYFDFPRESGTNQNRPKHKSIVTSSFARADPTFNFFVRPVIRQHIVKDLRFDFRFLFCAHLFCCVSLIVVFDSGVFFLSFGTNNK